MDGPDRLKGGAHPHVADDAALGDPDPADLLALALHFTASVEAAGNLAV